MEQIVMGRPPIGIVLVNYKGWQDTIECLESVLHSTTAVRIVVVDNASPNESMAEICAWAQGHRLAQPASQAMREFMGMPAAKPVDHQVFKASDLKKSSHGPMSLLTIVESETNLGFAGGNNIGLKYLMQDPLIEHFWLLNNDTVIATDTAEKLDDSMRSYPNIGMAGTTVCFYYEPDKLQAKCGYKYSPLTGQAKAIGHGSKLAKDAVKNSIADNVDFILGASLAVTRVFLNKIGYMEESYFLYYEEIDWSTRNRRSGASAFSIVYAADAIVWHKEGGSIGSSSKKGERSVLADYWLNRSRLTFTRRYYPYLLPLHWLQTLALVARRLVRGQPANARNILRALFGRRFSA
jgi:hypothetical protein